MPPKDFDPISEAFRQWTERSLPEPSAMAAATSIIRAQQIVETAVDRALRPIGLTFARYELLMLLSFSTRGELPITKMGERLMIHPTGVTKLVDKLEQSGLVERSANPRDRRGTLVHVTPGGRALSRRATRALGDVRFGVDVDERALTAIVNALRQLRLGVGDVTG